MNTIIFLSVACLLWLFADALRADERLLLSKPIDCQLGNDCWIVNLVDRDTGAGVQDFKCASHGYDGHKGVDIAIRDLAVMDDGVPVLAAAAGIVQGVRNHMDDIDMSKLKDGVIDGLDCGNGLVIQHAGDWETQYCHMRRGSVRVEPGQRVDAGTVLGYVGNSGRAEFPHLHLSVRHSGQVVDPFTSDVISADTPACTEHGDVSAMWDDPLVVHAPESMTAIYALGFAPKAIKPQVSRTGQYKSGTLKAKSAALAFWIDIFWIYDQDRLDLKITGPDGAVFHEKTIIQSGQKARRFALIGKKRRTDAWPTGTYSGEVKLTRTHADGSIFEIQRSTSVVVE